MFISSTEVIRPEANEEESKAKTEAEDLLSKKKALETRRLQLEQDVCKRYGLHASYSLLIFLSYFKSCSEILICSKTSKTYLFMKIIWHIGIYNCERRWQNWRNSCERS